MPQPGLSCDMDNPADIKVLLASEQTLKHSFRYLKDNGIAGRLSAMAIGDIAIASRNRPSRTLTLQVFDWG